MNSRISWNDVFMEFAESLCKRSCCVKYKTASIITDGTQIVSLGYNGTFSKSIECEDYWRNYMKSDSVLFKESFLDWIHTKDFKDKHREWSEKNEVHAEINALNWISKKDITDNYKLYTVLSPCDQCAKTIISYGIKTLYYRIEYHKGINALKLLRENGVVCIKI